MRRIIPLILCCFIIGCSSNINKSSSQCKQKEQMLALNPETSFSVSDSAFLDLLNSDSSTISYEFPLLRDSMRIIESEDGLVRIYDDNYFGKDEDEASGFSKCTVQYKDKYGKTHAVWGDIKVMTGAWKEGDGFPTNGYLSGDIEALYTFHVDRKPIYVLELIETYPYHFLSIKLIAFHINNGRIEGYPFFIHREPDDIQGVEYKSNPVCSEFAIETDGFPDGQEMLSYTYDKEEKILFWIPYENTFDYYDAYYFDGKHLCGVECDVEKLLQKYDEEESITN